MMYSTCKVCGKTYRPKASNRTTCCGRECGLKLTGMKLVERSKVGLSERKEARERLKAGERQRLAEVRAERLREREKASLARAELKTFVCDHCGKSFTKSKNAFHVMYCSRKCSQRLHQNHANHLRRSRKKHMGVNPDHIPLAKLIKRDKGICYHCKRPIDATATVPHSAAPTRDHFIPLSKGGPHTWDNIVLACFKCNIDKCDTLPEQDGQRLMFAT